MPTAGLIAAVSTASRLSRRQLSWGIALTANRALRLPHGRGSSNRRRKESSGGVLKKHHRQRAHQAIVQAVVDFAGLTAVFDVLEELG
jgi:hypothetical protein